LRYRIAMTPRKSAPEPEPCSPIAFRHGSNGEYAPLPPTARDRAAEAMFREVADARARRLGMTRREFVDSACGTAAALYVINQVYGCGRGGYDVGPDAGMDPDEACRAVSGHEFIFDVQTHHVDPDGPWRERPSLWPFVLGTFPQAACGAADRLECLDRDHYLRELFIRSDTSVAVLSAVPAVEEENPLAVAEQTETRAIIERLADSPRLHIHGLVMPDRGAAQLEGMQRLAREQHIAAWKVYTQFGGWWLDDERAGIPFIEEARRLGVNIVCAHKGLTLPGFDAAFAGPRDIGPVARAFPDVRFVVYHSGYETNITEGPYDAANPRGVDTLIKTLEDNAIAPGANVYAELGSTWRNLMTRPTEAAHVLGKLLEHVGEDRILWGTDSIWYGSPQDQIAAFRAFRIPAELEERHGYPPLTDAGRAKILGLNAAALYGIDPRRVLCEIGEDDLTKRKADLGGRSIRAARHDYGPRTRRELFAFLRARDGQPG
jgi:hypothetical protein